jgi:acetolactate synthase I/II/III large subunit
VVIVADAVLQEEPVPENERGRLQIPKLTLASPPAGDYGALKEAAKMLVNAENPVIVAGRVARTPEGINLLVQLAETLQAPVVDRHFRMNFPTRHPLFGAGNVRSADVVLGLEVPDMWFVTHTQTPVNRMGMESKRITKPGAKVITIFAGDLSGKSNYQDFGRYDEVDLAIAADAQATLPILIEECRKLITSDRKAALQQRGVKLAEVSRKNRERDIEEAAGAWDASPISTARMSAELWNQIKTEDWSLVSDVTFVSWWPQRLWDFDKHYQFIGGHGAYGIGYGAPAAVGAALANKKHGRISVNIQCDGDLNYAPGVLWTAAHHRIPMLNIMHNNRAYHQEMMYLEDMAARARRGVENAGIGTAITDPNIDYATMAKAYGMFSEGPIDNPNDLGPAIKRALEVVKKGEPALIDVVTQPR